MAPEQATNSDRIIWYYDRIAPNWDRWRKKNEYYHANLRRLIVGMVSPNASVLDYGAGDGDLLEILRPELGVGINFVPALTNAAARRNPNMRFHTAPLDQMPVAADSAPDYLIMRNMLDHVCDLTDVLERAHELAPPGMLLVITTSNPLWAVILKWASRLGLRFPESPRNYITNRDIRNVLEISGFSLVEEGMALPMPVKIPGISALLNRIIPEIPIVRLCSSVQYLCARVTKERPPLACSVVIPCHNEEDNIERTVRRVPNIGTRTEIIIVDDGSTDATRERALALVAADPRVRCLAFDRNRGKAEAVYAAFEAATGDVVMILDADATVEPEILAKFFRPIQSGVADFVNGTRLIYPMQRDAMRFANFIGNKLFCFLASFVLRQRVSDTLCGTKAMLRADFLRMPRGGIDRWGDFDQLFGAARLKLRIREIPIHYKDRIAGKSKMKSFVEVWRFLGACLQGWKMLRLPKLHAPKLVDPGSRFTNERRVIIR